MAAGFVLGEVWSLYPKAGMIAAVLLAAGGILYIWSRGGIQRGLWLFPLFVILGAVRMEMEVSWLEKLEFTDLDGRHATVSGYVAELGSSAGQNGSQSLLLKDCFLTWKTAAPAVDNSGRNQQNGGKVIKKLRNVLVWVKESDQKLQLGNQVEIRGTVKVAERDRNPGEFDTFLYDLGRQVDCRFYGDQLRIQSRQIAPVREYLRSIKVKMTEILEQIASEEDRGILQAVLLGDRAQLDEEIMEQYQRNGIAHLLAVSGLHVSVIGMAVRGFFRKAGLGWKTAGVVAAAAAAGYGILAGFSPSVFRALVMLFCGFAAAGAGRTYDLLSAAGLAALLLFLKSPFLVFQGGVQLSFGAILGIGAGSEILVPWSRARHPCIKAALMGISIQAVTGPIVIYHYFQYPLYGIVINLILVPLMGYVIASGLAGMLAGMFNMAAGRMALGSSHYILLLYRLVCRWIERLPGANLILGRPGVWQLGIYYLAGILVLYLMTKTNKKQEILKKPGQFSNHCRKSLRMLIPAGWYFGMLFIMSPIKTGGLELTFLDVGQGDGIFLMADETAILSDCGSSDKKSLGKYSLEPFLKSKGVKRLDYVIVSHGDQDHISGILYLLEETPELLVDCLLLPEPAMGDPDYDNLIRAAVKRNTKIGFMGKGERLEKGNLVIDCLYPGEGEARNGRNSHSLVLKATYGNFCLLLTGDLEEEGERLILADDMRKKMLHEVNLLKVAHHGSKSSTREGWLEAVTPRWAVISYGKGNSYGHPDPQLIERLETKGISIWKTAEKGAIILQSDGETIQVHFWREGGRVK